MRRRNVKNDIFVDIRNVFQALNTQKFVFGVTLTLITLWGDFKVAVAPHFPSWELRLSLGGLPENRRSQQISRI